MCVCVCKQAIHIGIEQLFCFVNQANENKLLYLAISILVTTYLLSRLMHVGALIQWNGMVEWNTGME